MGKVVPINPGDVVAKKKSMIPDEVLEAFNEEIAEKWDGTTAHVMQKHVMSRIVSKLNCSRPDWWNGNTQILFDHHYLDVEDIYRKAGWTVEYDRPAYCETYEPSFKFKKKKKS